MKKTKKTALCAIFSSLGVVILYIGALLELLDLSTACICSFIVLFMLVELGKGYAFASYGIISVLSFLILPQKLPAFFFIIFFGLMPLTKLLFERIGTKIDVFLSVVLKLVTFNIELIVFGYFAKELLEIPDSIVLIIVYIVLCNVMFILCDILYGLTIRIYFRKIRTRIAKYLK